MSTILYDGDNGYNDRDCDAEPTIMEKRHGRRNSWEETKFFWDDEDYNDDYDDAAGCERPY